MLNSSVLPYVLEAHLVDHCNLNCKACSHFAPLVRDEVFLDVGVFRRDLNRLSEIFRDVYEIRLMGGEPLLHPEIIDFIKFSRQSFPTANISVSTNGILLSKMPEVFWQACVEFNAYIKITNYPINLNLERISHVGKLHQVRIKIPKKISEFFQFINIRGDSDSRKSFQICRAMYTTPFIRDGKLYSCSFAPHVHLFNEYFKQEIPVSDKDSINILENVTLSKVIDFLNHPIPLCKWCKTKRPTIQWGRSNNEIEDWIGGEADSFSSLFEIKKYSVISAYHYFKQISEMRRRENNEN